MSFFSKLINDAEKSVNPVHVLTLLLGLGVLVWGTHVAFHTHAMPDLTGAGYLLGGAGAANVAHKAEDIIDKIKGNDASAPKE